MYAIIEACGKQYKVEVGSILYLELLDAEENAPVDFKVLACGGEDGIKVGTPYVNGASVTAKVVKHGKGKKISVFTYKVKKSEKRHIGHRQPYTMVQVESINI